MVAVVGPEGTAWRNRRINSSRPVGDNLRRLYFGIQPLEVVRRPRGRQEMPAYLGRLEASVPVRLGSRRAWAEFVAGARTVCGRQ